MFNLNCFTQEAAFLGPWRQIRNRRQRRSVSVDDVASRKNFAVVVTTVGAMTSIRMTLHNNDKASFRGYSSLLTPQAMLRLFF